MIERLNDPQVNVIKTLAVYKFLTTSQMVRLGVCFDKSNLQKHIVGIRDRKTPYIYGTGPKTLAGAGRLESVYYLSPLGVEVAKELGISDPKYPINKYISHTQDYYHRKSVIDFEISVRSMPVEVEVFDRYFDTVGNNRNDSNLTSKTKVDFATGSLKADGIFILNIPELNERYLYCLEVHNGKDTKRALEQMAPYVNALAVKAPSQKYNFERGCRVLWLFEEEGCMKATQERAMQDANLARAEKLFLCKLQSDPQNIFFDWLTLKGEKVNMF